jgi:aminopeptidase 2
MLSDFLGEDKFLQGVSVYLKNHLYGNAVTHDLWNGISAATGLDITDLMDNWITKIGYPVITVREEEDGSGITVRQDRFLETGPAPPEDNETIWNVPLNIASTKNGKTSVDKTVLLKERETKISLDTSHPFKLNSGTTGVYRVLYTPERLSKIAAEAGKPDSVFTLDDRMGLIQDSFALAQAGFAKLSSSLTLVNLWKGETEYMVWRAIVGELSKLASIWWETPEVVEKLDAFRRALFGPLVDKLGYEYPTGEPVDTTLLRTLAVSQAASAGDKGVVKELKSRFKHYIDTGDRSKIPADLQTAIFTTSVKFGGRQEYDAALRIYSTPNAAPSDVLAGIAALASPQDISLLQETTELVTNKARNQDVISFFANLAGNFKARRLLTKYMEDEYDTLAKRFEGNLALGSLVKFSNSFYSTKEGYAAVEAFYTDKDTSKYNRALAQALDSIRSRASYVERSSGDLTDWLSNTEY